MKIAVIPGDGIGKEVIREGVKVLEAAAKRHKLKIDLEALDLGADRFLRDGTTMPPETMEHIRNHVDAVFLGALGDPRTPGNQHAKDILLGMRFTLDLYINLRPVRALQDSLVPLKGKTARDVNFVVFRENTEGEYVGIGGFFKKGTPDEIATQESINTYKGVRRIVEAAFDYARTHGRRRVTMADKSNVLEFGHNLWRRVFKEVGARYTDIAQECMYVDALCMEMIRAPERFDVIVTCNLFGDIITDLGAALQGGMGLAASGNIHPGKVCLFEPVHGSAPDIAGQNRANPLAAILTAGMMLAHLGAPDAERDIERAVIVALEQKKVTPELGGTLTTQAVGDFIARELGS